MEELLDKIKDLSHKVSQAIDKLDIDKKQQQLEILKEQMAAPDFWQDQVSAVAISAKASSLATEISAWTSLADEIAGIKILASDSQAQELLTDLQASFLELENIYQDLSNQLLLSGPHDDRPAIVTIFAGAGGVDAQDWAESLERMYLRFAEQNNFKVDYLSKTVGQEAGIKSATFKVTGLYAYGYLKNEKGVHRLVRLSPYDADHARHTSFAAVEVLPEIDQVDFVLSDKDLKIDTFRSSGHGGQSVNTTDSAVRITHLPTGIVATCQNERSQMQNKSMALSYLKSKLHEYYQAEKEEERKILKGEYTQAAWGNQIRSYVLHPYKMVKDHRTSFETKDPNRVLDGDIMPFIMANLQNMV